jgi:competence protein ComEC
LQASLPFWVRSQPLIPLALLFAGGIAGARAAEPEPALLIAGLIAGATLLLRWPAAGWSLLAAFAGASIYWARYEPFSENDLRVLLTGEPVLAQVRGELKETPQVREFDEREISTARLRVRQILLDGAWQEARGDIVTRTRGELDDAVFYQGQHVQVSGALQHPRRALAPGLFDPRAYFRTQIIFFQLQAESAADWRVTDSQPMPRMERLRRWAREQISRGLPDDEPTRMLWAMTLGWKTALSGEMARPFMHTGTLHIIAVSGLHVACIAMVLLVIMHGAGLPRWHCIYAIIPLLWAYTIMTGWQSSGVRSALMATALMAGWAARRPATLLNSTAAAALLLLAFQPEQLFQTGFQLSFAVVASIGLLDAALESSLWREWRDDPFLPRDLWPRWRKVFNRLVLLCRPNFKITLASFLGSLPLTAWYFNLVTPISLIANLAAVPLSSLALTLSMLSLMTAPLGAWPLNLFLNYSSWLMMRLTISVARAMEGFGGYFYVPKPGLLGFAASAAILAMLAGARTWPGRGRLAGWLVAASIGFAALLLPDSKPQLHVLPADGAPVFVDLPGHRRDLMIDCSSAFDFDHLVRPFLRAQGVNRMPTVVLTHGDIRHIGAFPAFAAEFAPGTVYAGPHRSRSPADKLARAHFAGVTNAWRVASQGAAIAGWDVLHPAAGRKFPRADDNALVLRTTIEGWRILCVSDLGREGARALARSGANLSADVLLMGASSGGRVSEELLSLAAPRLVVYDRAAFDRLDPPEIAVPLLTPKEHGAISMEFTPEKCVVNCASGQTLTISRSIGNTPASPEKP